MAKKSTKNATDWLLESMRSEHTILYCILLYSAVLYTWCCVFILYVCTICCVNSIRWEISLLHAFRQIYRWDTQWNFRARGNTFAVCFFISAISCTVVAKVTVFLGRSHSFTLLNTLSHTHTDFPNLSKKNILNEMSEISLDKYTWNGVAQLFYCYDKGGSKFIFVLFQIIYLRFVFYSAQILWHSCLPSCVLYIYIYIYIYIYVYEYQIIFAEKKKRRTNSRSNAINDGKKENAHGAQRMTFSYNFINLLKIITRFDSLIDK